MSAGARAVGGSILNREFKWLIGFFAVESSTSVETPKVPTSEGSGWLQRS